MHPFILFALAVSLFGFTGSNGVSGPPVAKEAVKMDPLADWPSDAPLQLRPRVGQAALTQQTAEKKAWQYLGIGKAKELGLAPAYLTDNDFPFLRPDKQASWLAEVRDLKIPAPQGKPVVFPHLYLAIEFNRAFHPDDKEPFEARTATWKKTKCRYQ